jgi:hypothetical protein
MPAICWTHRPGGVIMAARSWSPMFAIAARRERSIAGPARALQQGPCVDLRAQGPEHYPHPPTGTAPPGGPPGLPTPRGAGGTPGGALARRRPPSVPGGRTRDPVTLQTCRTPMARLVMPSLPSIRGKGRRLKSYDRAVLSAGRRGCGLGDQIQTMCGRPGGIAANEATSRVRTPAHGSSRTQRHQSSDRSRWPC